jgi:ATP-binding cassette subfamily C protein
MVGAGLILLLLRLVSDPSAPLDVPLIGDMRQFAPGGQDSVLATAVAVLVVFFLLRAAILLGRAYCEERIANNAGARLAARLARGYLAMPYAFHLQRNSAELIRNAFHTVQAFVRQVLTPAVRLFADTLMVFGLLAVLFVASPMATALAVAAMGPLVYILMRIIQPRMKELGRTSQLAARDSLQSIQQSLGGVRDIQILGRERYFSRVFSQTRLDYARAQYLKGTAVQLPRAMIETVLILYILAFFSFSVFYGDAAPEETVSVIGLFAYVGLRLQPSLQKIAAAINNMRFSGPAIDDLYNDLKLLELLPPRSHARAELPFTESIRLENVSFHYDQPDRPALVDVDLSIQRGESIGICGATGGGKSTLVDVIAGLLEPSSGRLLVDGNDVRDAPRSWFDRLGVVSQSVFLIDDTLRQNIAFGVDAEKLDETRVLEAVQMAQLTDFVSELPQGLDTRIGERGVRLSGGQRQRVAIARALYRQPDVLIFDEGTSALDNTTEAELVEAIERLRGDRTIITVAHRLTTVRRCDRILFMHEGRVAAAGTYSGLLESQPAFRQMAATQ